MIKMHVSMQKLYIFSFAYKINQYYYYSIIINQLIKSISILKFLLLIGNHMYSYNI
jgi:hypothetical protein